MALIDLERPAHYQLFDRGSRPAGFIVMHRDTAFDVRLIHDKFDEAAALDAAAFPECDAPIVFDAPTMERYVHQKNGFMFTMHHAISRRLVGEGQARPAEDGGCVEFDGMAIHPDARGHDLSNVLIEAAKHITMTLRHRRIVKLPVMRFTVRSTNGPSLAHVLRAGARGTSINWLQNAVAYANRGAPYPDGVTMPTESAGRILLEINAAEPPSPQVRVHCAVVVNINKDSSQLDIDLRDYAFRNHDLVAILPTLEPGLAILCFERRSSFRTSPFDPINKTGVLLDRETRHNIWRSSEAHTFDLGDIAVDPVRERNIYWGITRVDNDGTVLAKRLSNTSRANVKDEMRFPAAALKLVITSADVAPGDPIAGRRPSDVLDGHYKRLAPFPTGSQWIPNDLNALDRSRMSIVTDPHDLTRAVDVPFVVGRDPNTVRIALAALPRMKYSHEHQVDPLDPLTAGTLEALDPWVAELAETTWRPRHWETPEPALRLSPGSPPMER